MKAVVLTASNQLELRDVATPSPKAGEALVSLRAAALNHRDVWIWKGQYAGLKYPSILGSDGAGVVTAVGNAADEAWVGREVVINPSLDWGANSQAQGNDFNILGLPRDGTLAEAIAVPVSQLAAKPEHLSWEQAAALPLAGLTAYRALFSRAGARAGEKILVSGIGGGVASFVLQFALAARAKVWVTSSSPEKIVRASKLGAQGGFLYTDAEWVKKATTEAGGFDVIVDSAGGPDFERLVDAAAPGARLVFFGATRGNPPVLPMRKVFWRQLSLLGTTMGSPSDWADLITFVREHRLVPAVSDFFKISETAKAFERMDRGEQFGKIVVTF